MICDFYENNRLLVGFIVGLITMFLTKLIKKSSKLYIKDEKCIMPTRGTKLSAGLDLHAMENMVLTPNQRSLVKTNVFMNIPEGYYGQILARSSLAICGIDVAGGVIDADYDREIKVILCNNSQNDFIIKKEQRIAQLVIIKIGMMNPIPVEEIKQSQTRTGGFGSTNK